MIEVSRHLRAGTGQKKTQNRQNKQKNLEREQRKKVPTEDPVHHREEIVYLCKIGQILHINGGEVVNG